MPVQGNIWAMRQMYVVLQHFQVGRNNHYPVIWKDIACV